MKKSIAEIYNEKSLDYLEDYHEESSWPHVEDENRKLLAILFVMRGEQLLESGDQQFISYFEKAEKVLPNDAHIFLRIAIAYTSQRGNVKNLLEASRYIEKSTKLDPDCVDSWHAWGNILVGIGSLTHDIDCLYLADKKYAQAIQIEPKPENLGIFWQWGVCWHLIGKHSGEATDYHTAISKYRMAADADFGLYLFLNDYASALVDLGSLISREEFLFEAVELYRTAVEDAPTFFEGWFNLACAYHIIYEITEEIDYFHLARGCFENAVQLNPNSSLLWMKWGNLLANGGKFQRNVDLLEESMEKLEKADCLQSHEPETLSKWAEVIISVGVHKERLDYFKLAEQKIVRALQIHPENSHYWYIYGQCLNEVGRYFNDEKYYLLAIEKLQHGLSLNHSDPLIWYALALSHFALGDLKQDPELLHKTIKYCAKVIQLGGDLFPQFWNDWGVALMKMGELCSDKKYIQEAIEKFEEAIRRHNRDGDLSNIDPDWLYNCGCAYDFMGDFEDDERYYERAIHLLSQALSVKPDFTFARYNLALALTHLGEITSEVDFFYQALHLFEQVVTEDCEDEMAWNDWGLTLMQLSQLMQDPAKPDISDKLQQEAEQKFVQAISFGSIYAYYNLACLYSINGNYTDALHYLERAEAVGALPPIEDIMHDEWLEGLRSTHHFRSFVKQLSNKPSKDHPHEA